MEMERMEHAASSGISFHLLNLTNLVLIPDGGLRSDDHREEA